VVRKGGKGAVLGLKGEGMGYSAGGEGTGTE